MEPGTLDPTTMQPKKRNHIPKCSTESEVCQTSGYSCKKRWRIEK